jgi:hypothetical protein
MRNWLFSFAATGYVLVLALIISSCSETIPIGTEVLPDGDRPDNVFTDTTTIYSWTVREDSMRSDKLLGAPIGYMEDPLFGNTKSSLLVGFRTPSLSINGSLTDTIGGYYLDSIVLALMISDVYGDTTLPMDFTVYKLPSPLNADQVYYSGFRLPTSMVEVGRATGLRPSLYNEYDEDTILTDLGPQLRIKLNPFFGQSLLNILNTDVIESDELFHRYLPGLVIVPDDVPGSMVEIGLVANPANSLRNALQNSRIQIYYKNADDNSLGMIFNATTLNLGISKFEHDYASTNVEAALMSEEVFGDPVNYVQGLAGVKTRVEMPYLDEYDASTAVLKAELVITQIDAGGEDVFVPAPRLLALRIDEDGGNANTSDYSTFPAGHFNGFAEEVTLENGQEVIRYRVNISDYVQRLINGNEINDGLYITLYPAQVTELIAVNASDLIPNRVVIGGGNNTVDDYRMKLDLTYTILD